MQDCHRCFEGIYWKYGVPIVCNHKEELEMQLNKYQYMAARTAPKDLEYQMLALNMCLGLAGETGETVDYLKKVIFHGHTFNRDNLVKELGDILWYVSQLAWAYKIPLDEIGEKNIEKLRNRYPDGFSTEDSINRVE